MQEKVHCIYMALPSCLPSQPSCTFNPEDRLILAPHLHMKENLDFPPWFYFNFSLSLQEVEKLNLHLQYEWKPEKESSSYLHTYVIHKVSFLSTGINVNYCI